MTFTPRNENVLGWCFGTDEGKTQFERMLDNIDKALEVRMFLATQERPHYDAFAYDAAQNVTYKMFYMISGDWDIVDTIDHLWLDSNSDIRYILTMMFTNAMWAAQNEADMEADERAYQINLYNEAYSALS